MPFIEPVSSNIVFTQPDSAHRTLSAPEESNIYCIFPQTFYCIFKAVLIPFTLLSVKQKLILERFLTTQYQQQG